MQLEVRKEKVKQKWTYNKRKPKDPQSTDSIDTNTGSGKTWRACDYKMLPMHGLRHPKCLQDVRVRGSFI